MLKKSVVFILIILITLSPVYSISLFPREQPIYTSNINIEKVLRTDNNLQLLISANKNIDGLIIQINNNQIITSDNKIDRYSTISILVMSKETPTVIEVNSYNDFNHRRTINKDNIIYTITNQEQPILEQPSLITTIQPEQQQEQPQQLVNEPEYISYTSISKLDDEKNLIYFTKDHISSNRITTNQQGGIEYQANYQPYGNIFTQEGNEKFKFSGKELDSTNLYYFGARYYNSNIGRFTQVDPIFKAEESPYQYANNNPIKYVDPTGQQTSGCENGANCGLTSSGNVPLDAGTFTYPAYNGITAGGTLNLRHLDNGFYEGTVRAAVEHGLDPYYLLAASITEAGPVNIVGHEATIAPDENSQILGPKLGVGIGYIRSAGAAAQVSADARLSGMVVVGINSINGKSDSLISAETPTLFNQLLTVNHGHFIRTAQSEGAARDPNSPLNIQSYILLRRQQQRALAPGPSPEHRLQRLVGNGELWHAYKQGNYPNDVGGITGREYPVNGLAIAQLMQQLSNNPNVRSIIPPNAPTPVLNMINNNNR